MTYHINNNDINPVRFDQKENTVYVSLKNINILNILEVICAAIAESNLEENPCGLFRHPLTDTETTLIFTLDGMHNQDAMAMLIKNMYIACNNPAHIIIETYATEPIEEILIDIITSHLMPYSDGGYVAEDRPKASWIWRCQRIKNTSAEVIKSFKKIGGEIEFF